MQCCSLIFDPIFPHYSLCFCGFFVYCLTHITWVKHQKGTDFALLQALYSLSPKFQSNLQTCYLVDPPIRRR